jgi:hypothetical protein
MLFGESATPRARAGAGSGSGFYYINQKPESARAWVWGKACGPKFFAYLVKAEPKPDFTK